MKKLKKFLLGMSIFLCHVNICFASSLETMQKAETSHQSWGKIGLFVIGIVLISLVLYIGYKMDKTDDFTFVQAGSKKEKKEKKSYQMSKNTWKEETVEDVYQTANENDIPYEIEENEMYEKDKINLSDINENTEYTDDGDEESLFASLSKVKGYDFEEEIEDYDDTKYTENQPKEVSYHDNFSDTNLEETTYVDGDIEETENVEENMTTEKIESTTFNDTQAIVEDKEDIEDKENIPEVAEEIVYKAMDEKPDYQEVQKPDIIEEDTLIDSLKNNRESELEDFQGFTTLAAKKEMVDTISEEMILNEAKKKEKKTQKDSKRDNQKNNVVAKQIEIDFLEEMEKNLIQDKNRRLGIEDKKDTNKAGNQTKSKEKVSSKSSSKKSTSKKSNQTEEKVTKTVSKDTKSVTNKKKK